MSKGHRHFLLKPETKNIRLAFFLNISFTILEIAGGLFTNSIAIYSDALHDFGDSLSLGLAWYFQIIAQKDRDNKYSYGYARFSVLAALINGIILFGGSLFIIVNAIERVISPVVPHAPGMMILAIIGIIINSIAWFRLHQGDSLNEKVISLHMLEDVAGWVAVLLGSLVIYFWNFTIIDPLLSLMIAAFILLNVYRNLKQAFKILMQGTPVDTSNEKITQIISETAGVQSFHDLHIWTLDGNFNVLTTHLVVGKDLPPEEVHKIKDIIRSKLIKENIHHATIETEFSWENCEFLDKPD